MWPYLQLYVKCQEELQVRAVPSMEEHSSSSTENNRTIIIELAFTQNIIIIKNIVWVTPNEIIINWSSTSIVTCKDISLSCNI